MRAREFRAGRVLFAVLVVALLVWALAAPVAAQETTAQAGNEVQQVTKDEDTPEEPEQSVQEGAQQADPDAGEQAAAQTETGATDSLGEAEVTIQSPNDEVNRIEIAAADCDVEKGATVTVADGEGESATFVDASDAGDDAGATISSSTDQVTIEDIDQSDLNDDFGAFTESEDAEVTDSTGIECGRADDGDERANENGADANGDDARDADELLNLSCAELLVLFRAENGGQYGDASDLADGDVRARIEVCLRQEIVKDTAADDDLPDTGGLSLIGLAVLGVVSAAAGLSIVRGGRR